MEGTGSRLDGPFPPRGLDPRTVAACFPRTGGGSGRRRGGGARREGSPSLVSPTPTLFFGRGVGRPARSLGRRRGAQTKGACAFKAGSPGAGGEGTSGSGVEGGCAGQQGGGAGRADGGRREGRPGRAGTEQDRGTAGRLAGARGGGGEGVRGKRQPWPAGETHPGVGEGSGRSVLRAAGGLPPGSESFFAGRGSGDGESQECLGEEALGPGGWQRAVGEVMGVSRLPALTPSHTRPSSSRSKFPAGLDLWEKRARGEAMFRGFCCGAVARASKFGVEWLCFGEEEAA